MIAATALLLGGDREQEQRGRRPFGNEVHRLDLHFRMRIFPGPAEQADRADFGICIAQSDGSLGWVAGICFQIEAPQVLTVLDWKLV